MIGIVGGGISGLAVAEGLRARGMSHVLFEARPDPGGVMRTHRGAGQPLDVGPQRTRVTREVDHLIEAAGLEDEVVDADEGLPLFVFRDGKLRAVPFSLTGAISTDLLSWRSKLRILGEIFTAPLDPEESVEHFFVRKFGREAYENLIGPLYGGLYASDPSQMKAGHGLRITLDHFGVQGSLLRALLERGAYARKEIATVSFREGLQALPRALAEKNADAVRLGCPVTALRRQVGGGWRITAGSGTGEEQVEVDTVVLSCPSPVAARLLEPDEPAAAAAIARLNVNRLAVVHLHSDYGRPGLGYQVAYGEAMETRGVTWNDALFGRDGIYTCYLGGMRNPEVPDWPEARIADTAQADFETVTGADSEVLNVTEVQIPAWDRSWDALEGLEMPDDIRLCSNWSARPGIPGRAIQALKTVHVLARARRPAEQPGD
jgi:oxygen-dependent protoporphyrinogen oxidase